MIFDRGNAPEMLRRLANALEAHPELPIPLWLDNINLVSVRQKEDLEAFLKVADEPPTELETREDWVSYKVPVSGFPFFIRVWKEGVCKVDHYEEVQVEEEVPIETEIKTTTRYRPVYKCDPLLAMLKEEKG
ncbi:MAG: hypothetical protein JRI39_00440 [Deltaproteobacteria bacterium]|nr:hypothetical protein [Deltaproteobacteria bacterium]